MNRKQTRKPPSENKKEVIMPHDQLDELRAKVSRLLDSLDPTAPISSTVVFKVEEQHEQAFEQSSAELARATRRMPGINVFDYHRHLQTPSDPENPLQYLIYES